MADGDFERGDIVRHGPTGEEWVLKRVHKDRVEPAGWPACQALASDCTLVERSERGLRLLGDAA